MTTIRYAMVNDVFAALEDGSSISIEECPGGSFAQAADLADKRDRSAEGGTIVLSLTNDTVGGAPIDTLWFHPDQDNRLAIIDRARAALDAAEAALEAVGYMDKAHLGDYRTAAQRERNAFELGRDSERTEKEES